MLICKKCNSENCVKNGFVRGKQRYCCKECGCNFIEGDARTSPSIIVMKSAIILMYTMCKASYRVLGRIFRVNLIILR